MQFTKNVDPNKLEKIEQKIVGQQPYVDEQGKIVKEKNLKKQYTIIGIIIFIIILLIGLIMFFINNSKNKKCTSLEDLLRNAGYKYAKDNDTLPTIISDPVTFSVSELIANGYLNSKEFSLNESTCSGTVKIVNAGDKYLQVVNLEGCNYCTTSERYGTKYDKETLNYKKTGAMDVIPYYNYTTKNTYYTSWTSYFKPQYLEDKPLENYTDSRLPKIPNDSKNQVLEHEDVTYYRHKDKKWRFYQVNNNNYSVLSCEQPAGYSKKDINTQFKTEWSEWSLQAPTEEKCVHSDKATGYRWYKVIDGNKIYWKNGAYSPKNPDEEENSYTKDTKDTATLWRYYKVLHRWYNGESRKYSSYMSEANNKYKYIDNEIFKYSDYTSWKTESLLTEQNRHYRTEESEVRKRFRIKYDQYSFNLLDNYVSKEDFAAITGRTLEDVYADPKYAVTVEYKYIYRKK